MKTPPTLIYRATSSPPFLQKSGTLLSWYDWTSPRTTWESCPRRYASCITWGCWLQSTTGWRVYPLTWGRWRVSRNWTWVGMDLSISLLRLMSWGASACSTWVQTLSNIFLQRLPSYRGMLVSDGAAHWFQLSNMFLGPACGTVFSSVRSCRSSWIYIYTSSVSPEEVGQGHVDEVSNCRVG